MLTCYRGRRHRGLPTLGARSHREQSSHVLRIQKTLEDANIKLDSVKSDIMGKSGRAMIKALIAGERDPAKLARLADGRLKASPAQLCDALRGRVAKNHRFLLRLHLEQIDALDAAIAAIDRQVEADIAPFRAAVIGCGTIIRAPNRSSSSDFVTPDAIKCAVVLEAV